MRGIGIPVRDYAPSVGATLQVQPSQILPNFGPIFGWFLDLSVTLAGATASKASNTIDNLIARFALDDAQGENLWDLLGTDITVLLDGLSPSGQRVAAPTITTDGGGAGTADYHLFWPVTVDANDMPAVLKVNISAGSSLQNGNLLSAGTVTMDFSVRAFYNVDGPLPSLRIKVQNPPVSSGSNALGPYLPGGFQAELLMFTLKNGDLELGYVTLLHRGSILSDQAPLNDFVSADAMLMRSGHLAGEFILRQPIFVVDSTTFFTVNLSTAGGAVLANDLRLYTVATVPQKQRTG